jgi:hypothetical protein
MEASYGFPIFWIGERLKKTSVACYDVSLACPAIFGFFNPFSARGAFNGGAGQKLVMFRSRVRGWWGASDTQPLDIEKGTYCGWLRHPTPPWDGWKPIFWDDKSSVFRCKSTYQLVDFATTVLRWPEKAKICSWMIGVEISTVAGWYDIPGMNWIEYHGSLPNMEIGYKRYQMHFLQLFRIVLLCTSSWKAMERDVLWCWLGCDVELFSTFYLMPWDMRIT